MILRSGYKCFVRMHRLICLRCLRCPHMLRGPISRALHHDGFLMWLIRFAIGQSSWDNLQNSLQRLNIALAQCACTDQHIHTCSLDSHSSRSMHTSWLMRQLKYPLSILFYIIFLFFVNTTSMFVRLTCFQLYQLELIILTSDLEILTSSRTVVWYGFKCLKGIMILIDLLYGCACSEFLISPVTRISPEF